MEASFLTKFFSCSYCGASILREESITNTISKSLSHFGSGWLGVVVATEEIVVEDCVVGVGLVVVASFGVVPSGPGGSFKQF